MGEKLKKTDHERTCIQYRYMILFWISVSIEVQSKLFRYDFFQICIFNTSI
jgi:hypothetical protein